MDGEKRSYPLRSSTGQVVGDSTPPLPVELCQASPGKLFAAIVSAVLFALSHYYLDSAGMISAGILGFILAFIFLFTASIVNI